MKRRDFLKASSIGAAALAFPVVGCSPLSLPGAREISVSETQGLTLFGSDGFSFELHEREHRVAVFANGAPHATLGGLGSSPGQLNGPAAVAVHEGRLYVADCGNHRVQIFDYHAARALGTFGGWGQDDGQLAYPGGLAVDRSGRILVSDTRNHRVQVFDPEGRWLATFGHRGTAEETVQAPLAIGLDAEDHIHVVDCGNGRVQVYGPDGSHQRSYGHDAGLYRPRTLVLTPEGVAYVGDPTTTSLPLFDTAGSLLERRPLEVAGVPAAPMHLMLASDGRLLVGAQRAA